MSHWNISFSGFDSSRTYAGQGRRLREAHLNLKVLAQAVLSALNLKISDLESLAEKIGEGEDIEKKELCSGNRRRSVVRSRKIFCQVSVKGMGYSGADVARFLGITTSAVNRLAASAELPDIKKYL